MQTSSNSFGLDFSSQTFFNLTSFNQNKSRAKIVNVPTNSRLFYNPYTKNWDIAFSIFIDDSAFQQALVHEVVQDG